MTRHSDMLRLFLLTSSVLLMSFIVSVAYSNDVRSSGSGMTMQWNQTATWQGTQLPSSGDDVTIVTGDTVVFDCAVLTTVHGLIVDGVLQFENTLATSHIRTLSITGDFVIRGLFRHGLGSTSTEQDVQLSGNLHLEPGARLDLAASSTKGIVFRFNGPADVDQRITSADTTALITFQKIVVDRPSSSDRIVCSASVTAKGGNEALGFTKGTWEQTAGCFTHAAATHSGTNWWFGDTDGVFALTGSGSGIFSASITGANGSNGLAGTLLINTSGRLSVGENSGAGRLQTNGIVSVQSGTVMIWGRFTNSAGTTTIAGGNIRIDPQLDGSHTLGATSHPFEIQSASHFTMTGGTIVLMDPLAGSGAGRDIKIVASAALSITGGEIRIGDDTSNAPGGDGFEIDASNPEGLHDVVIAAGDGAGRDVALISNMRVNGVLTMMSGQCRVGPCELSISAPVLGNADKLAFDSESSLRVGGTSSGIPIPPGAAHLACLTVDNPAGATLLRDLTLTGVLRVSSGPLWLDSYRLTARNVYDGGAAGRCVVTNGSGALVMAGGGGDTLRFPVAPDGMRFMPVTLFLGPSDPVDTFSVNVANDIMPVVQDDQSIVAGRWSLSEAVKGANSIRLAFGWSSADEGARFMRWSAGIWQERAGLWEHVATGTTEGSDPYQLTASTLLSEFSSFIVGNDTALPVQVTDFHCTLLTPSMVRLEWTTLSEIDNYGFEVQKSAGPGSGYATVSGLIPAHNTSAEAHTYGYTDSGYTSARPFYRLRQVDLGGGERFIGPLEVHGTSGVKEPIPRDFVLAQNFPNPFNSETTIEFSLPESGHATLTLFSLLGQQVGVLFDGRVEPGRVYHVKMHAWPLASGVFFYILRTDNRVESRRMVLLR